MTYPPRRTLLLAKIANPFVNEVGTLQWFNTFAPADILNDRMFVTCCRPSYHNNDDRAKYWDTKRAATPSAVTPLMRDHPALQCRFFKWKIDTIWNVFIAPPEGSPRGIFGHICDHFRRIEFQGRGTPHEHSLAHKARQKFISLFDRAFRWSPRYVPSEESSPGAENAPRSNSWKPPPGCTECYE
jgi:hypothetical protein